MSTETPTTAQRLATAIEELEKLTRISEQLPARMEAAKTAVITILDEMGIEAKPAKRARRAPAAAPKAARGQASPNPDYVPAPGSMSEAIFAHLPGSIPGIAGALGEAKLTGVTATMHTLKRYGHVVADESTDPPIYRKADAPGALAGALHDAAGVAA